MMKKVLFWFFISTIVIFAICLRISTYINCDGFFTDETHLIYNLQNKAFIQMFLPLACDQCAPPLFMILGKLAFTLCGTSEKALKFIPLFSSIVSVAAFLLLSFKLFKSKISIIAANIIFCIHHNCIYYSALYKQYSTDVLFVILVLLTAVYLKNQELSVKKCLLLGFAAGFCFLFAYPTITAIIAVFFAYLIYTKFFIGKNTVAFCAALSFILILFLITSGINTINNDFLQFFWGKVEINFPANVSDLKDFVLYLSGDTDFNPYILSALFLSGIFVSFKYDKYFFCISCFTYIFAAIFGLLHLYPLSPTRVCLYLVPIFILTLSKPLDMIIYSKNKLKLLVIIPYFLFIPSGYHNSIIDTFHEKNYLSNAKYYIRMLKNSDFSENNYLYADTSCAYTFKIYDFFTNIPEEQIIYETKHEPDIKNENTLKQIPKNKYLYVCFTKEQNEDYINKVKTVINKYFEKTYEKKYKEGLLIKYRKL